MSKFAKVVNGTVIEVLDALEAINGLVQAAKARARGYRKPRNLILIAYLIAGNLSHLPASPYTTTSGGCRA